MSTTITEAEFEDSASLRALLPPTQEGDAIYSVFSVAADV